VRGRAASLAAIASLLLIAGGCIAVMSGRERHQLGTNWVRPVAFQAKLDADERLCQPGMRLPAGTGGIGVRIGTFDRPGPELRLTIRTPGEPDVRGALAPGWRQGDVVIPVSALATEHRDTRVCLEHDGAAPLAIAGGPGTGEDARLDGEAIGGMIRLEYVEGKPATWFPDATDMLDRLAVARDALPGGAALPLFALLAVGVLGGALLLVVREGNR
jgi:hypothetical protein